MDIDIFCERPLVTLRINEEGKLSFCRHMDQRGSILGDLNDDIFDSIWFCDDADAIRLTTLEKKLHPLCQCPGCPFADSRPPYVLQHVTYNEYPTCLELSLPRTGFEEFVGLLGKMAHVTPNLSQIHVEGPGEPFQDGVLFAVLDQLKFVNHPSQIWVHVTTDGTGLTPEVLQQYLSFIPNSVTTFRLGSSADGLRSLASLRNPKRQFHKVLVELTLENFEDVSKSVQVASAVRAGLVFQIHPHEVTPENYGRFLHAQHDLIDECKKWGVKYECLSELKDDQFFVL